MKPPRDRRLDALAGSVRRSHRADRDEVFGMDPTVRERNAARTADRVAKRDRPPVLDQRDRGGGVRGDRVGDRPHRLLAEEAVLRRERAGDGARLERLLLAVHPEPDERAEDRAELLALLLAQVAELHSGDLTVAVLRHDDEVHEPNDVVLLETAELAEDLSGELDVVEADDQDLYRTELIHHVALLSVVSAMRSYPRTFFFCSANSSSVSTPCSCSCPSCWSFAIASGAIPPAVGAGAAAGACWYWAGACWSFSYSFAACAFFPAWYASAAPPAIVAALSTGRLRRNMSNRLLRPKRRRRYAAPWSCLWNRFVIVRMPTPPSRAIAATASGRMTRAFANRPTSSIGSTAVVVSAWPMAMRSATASPPRTIATAAWGR